MWKITTYTTDLERAEGTMVNKPESGIGEFKVLDIFLLRAILFVSHSALPHSTYLMDVGLSSIFSTIGERIETAKM